jgi:hypothetical protein
VTSLWRKRTAEAGKDACDVFELVRQVLLQFETAAAEKGITLQHKQYADFACTVN